MYFLLFLHPQNFSDTLVQVLSTRLEDGARKIKFFPTNSLIKGSKWGRAFAKASCLVAGLFIYESTKYTRFMLRNKF
jgi:hypothetical protein